MRLAFFLTLAILLGCKSSTKSNLEEMDLMRHGVPIVIKAPPDAEVKVEDMGVWTDITVKSGETYFIQILGSEAISSDIEKIKREKLEEAKQDPFFSKIIQEDEHGFIFEKDIDSVIDYDFRFIRIQGNTEYIFQTGLFGTFTEEQVRVMYESVQ